jgi:hypothetical protein
MANELVSAACGAGFVVLCESEYNSWRLFKKKKTLFFAITQLAILSTALGTALGGLIYFILSLRILPMLVIILIDRLAQNISYPIMILLRLKIICSFPTAIMYIPILLGIVLATFKYFWISWILTGSRYYFNTFSILELVALATLSIQSIAINIFFIIQAVKKFDHVIHIKYVIIVIIIIIILECSVVITAILFLSDWALWVAISIVYQIKTRLEISILAYITESAQCNSVAQQT